MDDEFLLQILHTDAYNNFNRIKKYNKEHAEKIYNELVKYQQPVSYEEFVKLSESIADRKEIKVSKIRRKSDWDLD
ncbi:dsDNA binding protein [Spraguea lophii 42_110]|uniref:DsDNA binding protein n=1 Tax=Spraguea lophii (strain 42_110) TaxID=1358809 RepID=S7W5J0_SPRLO|nr:dsDNA binding protein [Spraguea lophii 42_110]